MTDTTKTAQHRNKFPYQLCIVLGADTAAYGAVASTVVGIAEQAQVASGLLAAGVKVSDFRSHTVVVLAGTPSNAAMSYAELVGFSGRHLDVATDVGIAKLDRLVRAATALVPAGRPNDRFEHVHVSLGHNPAPDTADFALTVADANSPLAGLTDSDIIALRWARKVTVDVADSAAAALLVTSAIAGLTGRRSDRFPVMVNADGEEFDLEAARYVGAEARRGSRTRSVAEVMPRLAVTPRAERLLQAAQVPAETVLALMGCPTEGELWSCPRPLSHTHGDATPSMRVSGSTARCYVDDAEWVDSLRLVAVSLKLTADDAADLILGDPAGFDPYAKRIAEARASRQQPKVAAPPAVTRDASPAAEESQPAE
jgi:hypothetical protein